MDWIKVDKIPVIKIDNKSEFDFEKICTNRESFDLFKEYITSAYNYCLKTNPFSAHTFESINRASDRAAFQQFIGLVNSKSHEKILKEALEKEWKINIDFSTPDKYKLLESKLQDISDLPILDSDNLKFGFSTDEKLTANTRKAFIKHKLQEFRSESVVTKKGLSYK